MSLHRARRESAGGTIIDITLKLVYAFTAREPPSEFEVPHPFSVFTGASPLS
jgi:hypothetical protein